MLLSLFDAHGRREQEAEGYEPPTCDQGSHPSLQDMLAKGHSKQDHGKNFQLLENRLSLYSMFVFFCSLLTCALKVAMSA
jgi:hypothetical protein